MWKVVVFGSYGHFVGAAALRIALETQFISSASLQHLNRIRIDSFCNHYFAQTFIIRYLAQCIVQNSCRNGCHCRDWPTWSVYERVMLFPFDFAQKANLEINKEGLKADLVCMLEERLLPRNKADFEAAVEGFFIAGAARIDLIAKVIDLDNEMGRFNFDIPLLENTAREIESLGNSPGRWIIWGRDKR